EARERAAERPPQPGHRLRLLGVGGPDEHVEAADEPLAVLGDLVGPQAAAGGGGEAEQAPGRVEHPAVRGAAGGVRRGGGQPVHEVAARLVALRDQHGTRPHRTEGDGRGRDARRPLVGRERDECHGQLPPAPVPGGVPWPVPGDPPGTGTVPSGGSAPPGSPAPPGSSSRFRFPSGGGDCLPGAAAALVPSGISATATAWAEAAWVTFAASPGGTATSTLVWSELSRAAPRPPVSRSPLMPTTMASSDRTVPARGPPFWPPPTA